MKSIKPRLLSLYTALSIGTVATLMTSALFYFYGISEYVLYALALFVVLCFAGYLIINYALDKYFYQNIRIIYKNILHLQSSGTSRIPKKISDDRVISEINSILIEWEKENKDEIVHLKEMEVFRKEFLGNVSHELKTPIFTIQGYIHTLLDGGIEDQEVNILYLQKAARSIDRLISIVDDLESISRLEAGDLIMELRTFDIEELILEVIESLELRSRENDIKITLQDAGNNHHYVFADKERIRQVLVNLMVNSVKYGKKSGSTTVQIEDHKDYVTVGITDDGIGVEKQHVGRLFERFYRVDKSRSREQGGTGLGLAIVKHIIEAHNEQISVDSTPGIGTTFTFTLKKSK